MAFEFRRSTFESVRAFLILPLLFLQTSVSWATFEFPNELNQEDAAWILSTTNGDISISVGTERGFWGFGMAPTVSTLILVDNQASVERYNRLNVILGKIARGFFHYQLLRDAKTLSLWTYAAEQYGKLTTFEMNFLSSDNLTFWQTHQQYKEFDFSPVLTHSDVAQFEGNYLKDKKAFVKFQSACREGRIIVLNADLDRPSGRLALEEVVSRLNKKLAVLDLSNAWNVSYLTSESLVDLLKRMDRWASPRSKIVLTSSHIKDLNYRHRERFSGHRFDSSFIWEFIGISFSALKAFDVRQFVQSLQGYNKNVQIAATLHDGATAIGWREVQPGFEISYGALPFTKCSKILSENL